MALGRYLSVQKLLAFLGPAAGFDLELARTADNCIAPLLCSYPPCQSVAETTAGVAETEDTLAAEEMFVAAGEMVVAVGGMVVVVVVDAAAAAGGIAAVVEEPAAVAAADIETAAAAQTTGESRGIEVEKIVVAVASEVA